MPLSNFWGRRYHRTIRILKDVELGQPFKWIRWGGTLAGVALALTAQAQIWFEPPGTLKHPYWTISLVLHAVILGLFLLNTRDFPVRKNWHAPVLAAQMLLAIPLNSDFWILNALTIPIVRPPSERLRWLAAQIAAVPLSLGFLLWRQWGALFPVASRDNLWTQLYIQLGLGLLESLAWMLLAYLAALLIVQMESDRRRLQASNAELVSSRAMLAESSRVAERADMARELHDSLGHHLTTLNLELELAQRVPEGERDGHVRQGQLLARLLLADLRDSVSSWRRATASGLPEALSSLATGIGGTRVTVDVDPAFPPLDPARAHALLRCAQEAVTNALRHSAAASIWITLRNEGRDVVLAVRDNGHGCAKLVQGNGLAGILERAGQLGGQASFRTQAGGGFSVEMRLPLDATEAAA